MEAQTDASRVAATVKRHGTALLRVAQRYSLCADDAHDALQRGLEIYLRRLDRVDPATEVAWLKVVVKHEAMAVRRLRSESVGAEVPRQAVLRPSPAGGRHRRAARRTRGSPPARPHEDADGRRRPVRGPRRLRASASARQPQLAFGP